MDENQKKWAKVYGSLLKEIIRLYAIDRPEFIKEIRATDNSLLQWLSGSRLPPDILHNNICNIVKKHISDQKNNARNNIMTKIIKDNFNDLYKNFVEINSNDIALDNKMGEYISDLLIVCHFNGKLTPQEPTKVPPTLTNIAITAPPTKTEYDIGNTLDRTGLVVTATYSDDSAKEIGISELTISKLDSSTAGNKTITYNGKITEFTVTVNPADSGTRTCIDTFEKNKKISIFVTYAFESDEYKKRVIDFTRKLREMGFDATMDEFMKREHPNIDDMMIEGLKRDKVIVILSEKYKEKADNSKNSGVKIEFRMITNDLDENNKKYIFINFDFFSEELSKKITPKLLGKRYIIFLENYKKSKFDELITCIKD